LLTTNIVYLPDGKMIITKLSGGLGNQLFQYAVARHLAQQHNTELKLDITAFKDDRLRSYALSPFNIIENIASEEEIQLLKASTPSFFTRLNRKFLRQPLKLPSSYVREKHFHFDPEILSLSNNCYLEGYWQSEKYFASITNLICNEFSIKAPPTLLNMTLAETMKACNSVSIHIRRGDYITSLSASNTHGVCDIAYYQRALEYLSNKIDSLHFFIFSDDPDWVKINFNIPYQSTYVTRNDAINGFEDLRLMSQCQHHIIANSTFSWWGAWLSSNPNKIVIAPQQWFVVTDKNTEDMIPTKWKRL